jgi:hypothetical protein
MEHVSRGPRPVLLVLLAISTSLLEPLMLANTITKLDCDQLLAVLCCGASSAVVIMDDSFWTALVAHRVTVSTHTHTHTMANYSLCVNPRTDVARAPHSREHPGRAWHAAFHADGDTLDRLDGRLGAEVTGGLPSGDGVRPDKR